VSVSSSDETSAASAAAGSVARELLGLRGLAETEPILLRSLRRIARAPWAALYRPDDASYRRSGEPDPPKTQLPGRLDAALVTELLGQGLDIRPCADERLTRRTPGLALIGGLHVDSDTKPLLLLLGGRSGQYREVDLAALQEVAKVGTVAIRHAEFIEKLRSQVFIDFLTGCSNRRAFEEHLSIELVRARRYDRPLTLFLLDIDDFKNINDGQGHAAGDRVLKQVGKTLRAAFRATDSVFRYGGDEFAVTFPETTKEDVLRLAERLRRQVATIFVDDAETSPVRVSIGVAGHPGDGHTVEALIEAADRALYRAKSSGRNQVVAS
jgi:diguanylate cyclase (GGDEF)-like protein